MKAKLRTLKRVRHVRERLRNAASATLEVADRRYLSTREMHDGAAGTLTDLLDSALERLMTIRGVNDLSLFDETRGLAARNIVDAAEEMAAASAVSEQLRGELRLKERDLRSTDRVIDRVRDEIDHLERREEQKLVDDLAGFRWRRSTG